MLASGQNGQFFFPPSKNAPTTVCRRSSLKTCQKPQKSQMSEDTEFKELCALIKDKFYQERLNIAIKLKVVVKDPERGVPYLRRIAKELPMNFSKDFKWSNDKKQLKIGLQTIKKENADLKKDQDYYDKCIRSGISYTRKDSVICEKPISPFQALLIIDWDYLCDCEEIVFDGFSFETEDFYFLNKILDYIQCKYDEKKSEAVSSHESLQKKQKKELDSTDVDSIPNLHAPFKVTFTKCVFFPRILST